MSTLINTIYEIYEVKRAKMTADKIELEYYKRQQKKRCLINLTSANVFRLKRANVVISGEVYESLEQKIDKEEYNKCLADWYMIKR